jgi:hypothetical protein
VLAEALLAGALAKVQRCLHIIGAIVFPVGAAIAILEGDALVAIR